MANELVNEFKSLDRYEVFFLSIAVMVICAIITGTSYVLTTDDQFSIETNMVFFVISTLGTVFIMGNLGNNNISAKEVFWGWIILTVGLIAIACIGRGILLMFGVTNVF